MNRSGADTRIFPENEVNSIAVDALTSYDTRTSVALLLTSYNKRVLPLHKEGFQLPALSRYPEMIQNAE